MKSRFKFLRMDKFCKAKRKITTALLIFAMAVTSIAVSDFDARAEVLTGANPQSCLYPNSGYDAYISFYCPCFNICDTSGNILFEMVNDIVTQQDTERVTYVSTSSMSTQDKAKYADERRHIVGGNIFPTLPNDLYIKGCKNFIITCTCEDSVNAYTPDSESYLFLISTLSLSSRLYYPVPNTKIYVFDNEINCEKPLTELHWDKVEEAERYAILAKYQVSDRTVVGGTGQVLDCTTKTNYTVPCHKGKTYQILAQKKVKGEWRNLRCIEIIILYDKANTEIPTAKLRWKKVKGAQRYAVLENLRCVTPNYVIGDIPFVYTKKPSYTLSHREGRTYQVWAQKKVKGRWKTIKYFNITPSSYD